MNASPARLALASILWLAACATTPKAGEPVDTPLSVTDESGSSVPGEYELWGHGKDQCESSMSGCSVNLPEGDYTLTFTKERFGRLAQQGGGNAGENRGVGCLRSRIHLVPGVAISCKKRAEYNCKAAAQETMDCGAASIGRYGYKPGEVKGQQPPPVAPGAGTTAAPAPAPGQ